MTKRHKISAAAAALALILCTAGQPVQALSSTSIGYGQGTAVDSQNCPNDARAFDSQYAQYEAYATTPDQERIILTFDQGYENGYTSAILDTLKEKGVSAIFFLTGDYAKKETELVNRMIDEGHVLGNHGMTHADLTTLTEDEAKQEIMELHEYVKDIYDYEMQYFRFPCGTYSEERLETLHQLGYKTLFWSYAYVDWQTDAQPSPETALEGLKKSAHGGEILLLHSVSSTNAQILGDAIDAFRSAGFIV